VVTDQHDRRLGAVDVPQEAGQVGICGHRGLVQHHHGAVVEAELAMFKAPEQ
jgi:hypothetical protein